MTRMKMLPPTYLVIAIGLMLALHYLCPVYAWMPGPWNWLGGLLVVAGLALILWAGWLFRRAGTTTLPTRRPTELVTTGPYRFSRHPMYLGMVLALAGAFVMLGTVTPLAPVVAFAWIIDRTFIAAEEKMMAQTFGDAYAAYRRGVRRWL